jgi:hypothetical protein
MPNENMEQQMPLIVYRLDTTAKVLEEIKQVLDRQTENLTSLLVLQEKHNNLQMAVVDLKQEIDRNKVLIEKSATFVEQFYSGLYVGLFIFSILQGLLGWWAVDEHTQMVSLREQQSVLVNKIHTLEAKKG